MAKKVKKPIKRKKTIANSIARTIAADMELPFYLRRSKHGRDKLFATPELLWEAACEYFTAEDNNPWMINEIKGKDLKMTQTPARVPYTWTGLCLYVGCSERFFNTFEYTLADTDPLKEKFLYTLEMIRQVIRTQKFQGAAIGVFKENLIAYDLGIRKDSRVEDTDKPEAELKIEVSDEKDKKLIEQTKRRLNELDKN